MKTIKRARTSLLVVDNAWALAGYLERSVVFRSEEWDKVRRLPDWAMEIGYHLLELPYDELRSGT